MVCCKVELLVYRVEREEVRVLKSDWWVFERVSSYCLCSDAKS